MFFFFFFVSLKLLLYSSCTFLDKCPVTHRHVSDIYESVVEEVLRSFTEVKVAVKIQLKVLC